MKTRFDQPGYCTYQVTQSLLLKAVSGEDFTAELESASSFYGDDFSASTLQVQLRKKRVIKYLKTFSEVELSKVVTLLRANITYLRSTMGQARLNGLMLLDVHKDKTV